jgi:hypothetical protein
VLGVEPGAALSEYERIVIQDGNSSALKKRLAEQYPGGSSTKIQRRWS